MLVRNQVASPIEYILDEERYPALYGWRALAKRGEDITIASLLLILFAIPIAVIAIAIKLTSRGSVFFLQRRDGLDGAVFKMFKFRTMYTHLADGEGIQQTSRKDARVTPIGGWLRRKSIDELPQLFNVITGDMSLVGPRPHPIGMTIHGLPLNQVDPTYPLRYRVTPGITGWAQVNGNRGAIHSAEQLVHRVALDLDYIEHWSLWRDIKIMWLTVRLLIHDHNAY